MATCCGIDYVLWNRLCVVGTSNTCMYLQLNIYYRKYYMNRLLKCSNVNVIPHHGHKQYINSVTYSDCYSFSTNFRIGDMSDNRSLRPEKDPHCWLELYRGSVSVSEVRRQHLKLFYVPLPITPVEYNRSLCDLRKLKHYNRSTCCFASQNTWLMLTIIMLFLRMLHFTFWHPKEFRKTPMMF